MESAKQRIRKFLKDEQGATAVEYALLVGLIAAIIIVSVAAIGTDINAGFTSFVNRLNSLSPG